MTQTAQKRYHWIVMILAVFGVIHLIELVLWRHSFDVMILSDERTEHTPPVFLVERRWWNHVVNQYPIRYDGTLWEYERDGEWHLLGADIEKHVDLSYWRDDKPVDW